MTSINNLQSRISQHGITRPNRFQVELVPPRGLVSLLSFNPLFKERLAIQCETAQLPGKSFSTTEHRIYGPITRHPYTATFTSNIDLTFRIGTDYRERSIFDEWQNLIMNRTTNMFGYYQEYVANFVIHQFDQEDKSLYSVRLFDVWPEAIQPIELSAEAQNTYNRQTITFAYRQWEETDAVPLMISGTTTMKKAEDGKIVQVITQGAFAFFDQLPLITGSGGTMFGSVLN